MARKKKSRGSKHGAIGKVGKITFVYFSGDVGDFLNSLSKKLQEPMTKAHFKELLTAILAASQAQGSNIGGIGGIDAEFDPTVYKETEPPRPRPRRRRSHSVPS